jgi:hypothetical protein
MLLALEVLSAPGRPITSHFTALWTRNTPLIAAVLALFPVFAYDSIKLSNRFAGPMLRLRRAMREVVLEERYSRLEFRKDDFWQDVAENFNQIVERLQEKASADAAVATDWRKPNDTVLVPAGGSDEDAQEV